MKRSARYRQMARDVAELRNAYIEMLRYYQPTRDAIGDVTFRPRPDADPAELGRASSKMALVAGKATIGGTHAPVQVTLQQFRRQTTIDPIVGWATSLRNPEALPPEDLVRVYESMIGLLESKAEGAEATEGTWAGRIAAFVGFPARVRAIVAEDHPGLGGAAVAAGVFAQITIGVVIVVLGAAALAGVTALWKNVVHSTPAPATSRQPITPVTGPATPTSPPAPTPAPSHT